MSTRYDVDGARDSTCRDGWYWSGVAWYLMQMVGVFWRQCTLWSLAQSGAQIPPRRDSEQQNLL